MENAPIITAQNLNLWYGDFKALKNISLDVGERDSQFTKHLKTVLTFSRHMVI